MTPDIQSFFLSGWICPYCLKVVRYDEEHECRSMFGEEEEIEEVEDDFPPVHI